MALGFARGVARLARRVNFFRRCCDTAQFIGNPLLRSPTQSLPSFVSTSSRLLSYDGNFSCPELFIGTSNLQGILQLDPMYTNGTHCMCNQVRAVAALVCL